jgi:hypothetical protein
MRRKKYTNLHFSGLLKPLFCWFLLIIYINLSAPDGLIPFLGFYVLFSLALYISLNIFLPNSRSAVWTAFSATCLILKQFQLANILNIILLLGILVTFEIYFRKS